MPRIVSVWWDIDDEQDGNVAHIAEHGVSKDEVEDVLSEPSNPTRQSNSSGRPATFGWTATGKYIIVVWEEVQNDPLTAYPITAFEVPPPASA